MDPTIQNAMMLQALRGQSGGMRPPGMPTQGNPQMPTQMPPPVPMPTMQSGGGGAVPMPMAQSNPMMKPPVPMPTITPPVDPASMQGGFSAQGFSAQQEPTIEQMKMMQNNPVASALMGQIPGGGQ